MQDTFYHSGELMLEPHNVNSGNWPSGVVLVDDHEIVRNALSDLIRTAMRAHTIVGLANLQELRTYVALQPKPIDYLFLDLELPDAKGTTGLREALRLLPQVPVYVYTGSMDTQLKQQCVQLGARGVLDKAMPPPDLVDSLKRIFDEPAKVSASRTDGLDTLSPRQREVLDLMVQGLSNQAIGDKLIITVSTVKVHATAIFKAFGVNTRTEAIKFIKPGRDRK